jgi:hypothetical protein
MAESGSPLVRIVVREGALAGAAAVGSFLFFAHQSFEPPLALRWMAPSPLAFGMLTAVVYLFIRALLLVSGLFTQEERPELVLCPECGRRYDESRPKHEASHRRIALTPRPTEREVLAAIMLRRAIDEARRSSKRNLTGTEITMQEPPAGVENTPIDINEFERILRNLDFPKRPKRVPTDRRPKGPPSLPR